MVDTRALRPDGVHVGQAKIKGDMGLAMKVGSLCPLKTLEVSGPPLSCGRGPR